MTTEKAKLIERLKEVADDYAIDAPATCKGIDAALIEAGYRKGGGEMQRVERWEREGDCIYVEYDPERNRVSIMPDND